MDAIDGLVKTAVLALAFIAICTAIEMAIPREKQSAISRWRGLSFQAVLLVGGMAFVYPLGLLYRAVGLGPVLPPLEQWAGIWAIPVAILALDFLRYWEHRFEHRFMWAVHAVHHSPEELNAATGYGHPLHAIPMFLLVGVPLSLLNFSSAATPIAVGLLMSFMQHFIHSPVKFHLGKARLLIVDNRFHRIHHSVEQRHWDRNFGIAFTIWDRLFGTAHDPKPEEWPAVGVPGRPEPETLGQLLMAPFARR